MPQKTTLSASEKALAIRRTTAAKVQVAHDLAGQVSPARLLQQALTNPATLTTAEIFVLQQTAGNRAVGQLFGMVLNQLPGSSPVQSQALIPPSGALHRPAADVVRSQKIHQPEALSLPSSTSVNVIQRVEDDELLKKPSTGLPDNLKGGVESLSGLPDQVKVHYNSPKPAALRAQAYTQGTDIHLKEAEEEEKPLPHEAWHVVQQE